jgi:hypothetical protein
MMTKLSAALVAPPVAIVFLIVFIKKIRTNALGLIKQYLAFALVCVPLGLWFEIKNYVKYRVPITYVQEMSDKVLQYIGDRSFTSRITDFSKEQFSSVFEQWAWIDDGGNICGYNEYNPLIAMLKNSLFGESINSGYFGDVPSLLIVCRMFFWTTAILAAISLIVMLVTLFGKCTADRVHKLFFIAFYVCLVGNFYKMSAQYPFTCTMNFRYITPTVIINALFMGLFMSREEKSTGVSATVISAVSKLLMALTAIFCLLSYIVYIVVCYPVEQ